MIKELAKRAGIDLDDVNDEISQIVNVGIRDRNPERVLKFCQHLYVSIISYGMPGEMLGLPTAGMKLLYCDFTHHNISGMSLDDIFQQFKKINCGNCKNRKPHPKEWKWTTEWQWERDQNKPPGLKKILDAMFGRHRHPD